MKNKVTEYNINDLVSIKDMIDLSGKDKLIIDTMVRTSKLDTVAELASGKRGRPQRLFSREDFNKALDKLNAAPPKAIKVVKAKIADQGDVSRLNEEIVDEASLFSPESFTDSTGDAELDAIIAGVA